MKVHMLKSRTFRKTVLYFVIIIMIPILIFSYISIQDIIEENYNRAVRIYNADADRVSTAIDAKLMELMHIGNRLYFSKWVTRLRMNIDHPGRELTFMRKQEISQELTNNIVFTGILSNIVIIFPEKDLIVSPEGWHDIDYYFTYIASMDQEEVEKIYPKIQEFGYFRPIGTIYNSARGGSKGEFVLYQSLEVKKTPRATVLFFIDRQSFQSYINKITLPNLKSFIIEDGGVEIYRGDFARHNDAAEEDMMSFVGSSNPTHWKYICTYVNSVSPLNVGRLFYLIVAIILSFIIGLIMAVILAIISYRPLQTLLNRVFRHGEIYEGAFSEPFWEYSAIESSYVGLIDERKKIEERMADYEQIVRNSLLLRMLKGYFDDSRLVDRLGEVNVTFADTDYFCVILINIPENETKASEDLYLRKQRIIKSLMLVERIIKDYCKDYEIVDVLDDTFALIVYFSTEEGVVEILDGLFAELNKNIKNIFDMELSMTKGGVERGFVGISRSYQTAKQSMEYLIFDGAEQVGDIADELYYYPTDWEIQLINNLKIGKLDTVRRILDELRMENKKRNLPSESILRLLTVIMETQMRVLDELNTDVEPYYEEFEGIINLGSIDAIWRFIYRTGERICHRNQYVNTNLDVDLAKRVVKYIDLNYFDPSLSLAKLGEIFDMPISSLSKFFKDVTGINYSEYLSKIRMEEAKRLLGNENDSIMNIARRVGYENEYSFRRAFKRYEGITPSEYIEANRPV